MYELKENLFKQLFTFTNVLPALENKSIVATEDSSIFVGTTSGLIKFYHNQIKSFTTKNSGLISDTINVLVSWNNTVWAGTSKGLISFNKEVISVEVAKESYNHSIRDFDVNTKGKIATIYNSTISSYSKAAGWQVLKTFNRSPSDLAFDKNDTLWVAAGSLYKFKDKLWNSYRYNFQNNFFEDYIDSWVYPSTTNNEV